MKMNNKKLSASAPDPIHLPLDSRTSTQNAPSATDRKVSGFVNVGG